jgi:hypothetical protein
MLRDVVQDILRLVTDMSDFLESVIKRVRCDRSTSVKVKAWGFFCDQYLVELAVLGENLLSTDKFEKFPGLNLAAKTVCSV